MLVSLWNTLREDDFMSRRERIYHRLLAIYPAGLTYSEIAVMEKVDYRRAYSLVQPLIGTQRVMVQPFMGQQRLYAIPIPDQA